jgi:hypothetical protein
MNKTKSHITPRQSYQNYLKKMEVKRERILRGDETERTPNLDAALERARTGINLAGVQLLDAEIAATQMEDEARR